MSRLVILIYDFLYRHPLMGWLSWIVLTGLLVWGVLKLDYKEDISDFLPLDEKNQTALAVYQEISGANKLFVIVTPKETITANPDTLVKAMDVFVENVNEADTAGYVSDIMCEIDMEQVTELTEEVYSKIPLFLTDRDYARIDSLLADKDYVKKQLEADKEILLFPSSGVIAANITRDPLNLFSPVPGRLSSGGMDINFETYDSHILTPDMQRGIIILTSSFGARESEHNSQLVKMLEEVGDKCGKDFTGYEYHLIGGPAIAVANSERIKKDSIFAVCIAGILILVLLIYVFRNVRNILLILVSVGWGWLFAMGCISLYYDSVSIIVVGIASVILGIAVNYPLHLIDHLRDSHNSRSALKEIVAPLVIGNVTTVGAFLCLVPLNAPALHDLGLFSSLLLIGTILFVLVFLSHVVRVLKPNEKAAPSENVLTRLSSFSFEESRWILAVVGILTVVFAIFGFRTEFDSDMRNINYMTPTQKSDMEYFQHVMSATGGKETVYVVNNARDWDVALTFNEKIRPEIDSLEMAGLVKRQSHFSSLIVSEKIRRERVEHWRRFVRDNAGRIKDDINRWAPEVGFNPEAFGEFFSILDEEYSEGTFEDFYPLISSVFLTSVSEDKTTGRKSVVETLSVSSQDAQEVKDRLSGVSEFGGNVFDVRGMNESIASTLSDDFNYIGFACGAIVFLFLWISFGSFELAAISFLPMAVSWIWILGIMGMLGIKFNIVNIILATFIFGQGDDYTIFITEGLTYEFAYRKKVLESYKNSITVSALIMFIGIGTLVFSSHPAMRSLGQVTVIGMISVVLMAYLFPPLIFNWLVRKGGKLRYQPLTLCGLIFRLFKKKESVYSLVYRRYLYKGADLARDAKRTINGIKREGFIKYGELPAEGPIVVSDSPRGEVALLAAVMYPDRKVIFQPVDESSKALMEGCVENFVTNVEILPVGRE